jgi:hypothetical protein
MAALRAVEPFAGYVYSMAEAASGRGWGPLSPPEAPEPAGLHFVCFFVVVVLKPSSLPL